MACRNRSGDLNSVRATYESSPRGLGWRPERALQKDGFAQQRLRDPARTRLPVLVAHRLPQHRRLEVDQDWLERRGADDDVVQLGVSVREPAVVQRLSWANVSWASRHSPAAVASGSFCAFAMLFSGGSPPNGVRRA